MPLIAQPQKEKGCPALFITSVGNLQAARALAFDNNLAVLRVQLDLPNVTASNIGLFGD